MKTKSYNVYSFAELSPAARSRAIDDHARFLAEKFSDECTVEDAQQVLANAGLTVDKVYWSGFSSQDDGACFSGLWQASAVNAAKMREDCPIDRELHRIADGMAKVAAAFPDASFTVKHSGNYSHKYCTEFSFTLPEPDLSDAGPYASKDDSEAVDVMQLRQSRADEDLSAAENDLTVLARDAMEWIYRQLQKEYEYQTAEPQVIESIEANGYEFTATGKID